jgi:hypothetical protein
LKFLIATEHSYESEVVFCSSHLFELDLSQLCELPYEVFCSIISHKSLQLRDEDSLYELIKSQFCLDSRYSHLFEHIRFEYVSDESILSFIGLINTSFDILTFTIWEALSHRLSLSVSPTLPNDRIIEMVHSQDCSFAEGSPLNGIISYLTRKYNCHVGDRGIVSITASSVADSQNWPLRNVAYFENQNSFYTKDEPNSWICYDFKDIRIKPTHYSIRSRRDNNSDHLRCWTLESSQDGESWVELDRRENNTALNSQGVIASFSISQSIEVRMIRLRQLDKSSSHSYCLFVSAIELFGVVLEPKQ